MHVLEQKLILHACHMLVRAFSLSQNTETKRSMILIPMLLQQAFKEGDETDSNVIQYWKQGLVHDSRRKGRVNQTINSTHSSS